MEPQRRERGARRQRGGEALRAGGAEAVAAELERSEGGAGRERGGEERGALRPEGVPAEVEPRQRRAAAQRRAHARGGVGTERCAIEAEDGGAGPAETAGACDGGEEEAGGLRASVAGNGEVNISGTKTAEIHVTEVSSGALGPYAQDDREVKPGFAADDATYSPAGLFSCNQSELEALEQEINGRK